uniref:Uncharacterized protein n=1 Tax=Salarias fasciatus TaxID=181472 RepID=A0A672F5S3_SALFA
MNLKWKDVHGAERNVKSRLNPPDDEDLCRIKKEGAERDAASSIASRRKPAAPPQQSIPHIPEAADDFVRNFLRRAGLRRTLSSFQAEWYGSAQGLLARTLDTAGNAAFFIPDALTHRQLLLSELEAVRRDTEELRAEALAAGQSLLRTQREADFHRLQHRRVSEDKDRLNQELGQLRTHLESLEPALRQLEDKRQAALRQKMLISLQRDRAQSAAGGMAPGQDPDPARRERSVRRHPKDSELPLDRVRTPHPAQLEKTPTGFSLRASIRGHQLPISCIQLHPQELLLASASDDRSWRLWLMVTGEGHSDWLSGCSFHPDGSKLATTSGDATVRLWDLSGGACVSTLSGHGRPAWGCSFHSGGLSLASCSADRTVKVWDLPSRRCRLTLRRHAASVNSVCFLPSSGLLLSSSADRTVALWDARPGLCTATFAGHRHPCNHAAPSPAAPHVVASCDSGGVVKLWDLRNPRQPLASVDGGPASANQAAFSRSGEALAVASGDGLVRLVQVESCAVSSLTGHEDGVQSVTFDHRDASVVSAGSDGMINVWTGPNQS